jgi:hypothetical protein
VYADGVGIVRVQTRGTRKASEAWKPVSIRVKVVAPARTLLSILRYVHDVLKWARRRPLSFRRYLSQFRCVSRKVMKAGGKGQHPCFTYTPLQIRTDFLYNRRIESGLCRYSWPALPWQFSHPWVSHNNPGTLCPDAMFETIR